MSLNHLQILNWLFCDTEIKCKPNHSELQELWPQVIFNHSCSWVIFITNIIINVLCWHVNQCNVRYTVSDLEATKLKLWPIITEHAQKFICWFLKCHYVFRGHNFWMLLWHTIFFFIFFALIILIALYRK